MNRLATASVLFESTFTVQSVEADRRARCSPARQKIERLGRMEERGGGKEGRSRGVSCR